MNELLIMVRTIKKLVRRQDREILDIYVENLKKGEINVSRILVDEMQDYYKAVKGNSIEELEISVLCDELYDKTMEHYESKF